LVGSWETLPHQNSTYLLFCTRKYCNTATTNLLCMRVRIKTSQKKIRRNNLIMVSTRRSPQKKTRRATTAKRVRRRRVGFFSNRGFFPHHYSLVIISTFLSHSYQYVLCLSARFMLIRATTKIGHLMLITK